MTGEENGSQRAAAKAQASTAWRFPQCATLTGHFYAGTTEHGILVSGDCGTSWQRLSEAGLAAVWCLAETDCEAGRVLLAGIQGQGLVRFLQRQPDAEV